MNESTATREPGEVGAHVDHALAYAIAGLAVLPLAPLGKKPVTKHGKDDASTDPSVIRTWWSRNPLCNIGVRPQPGVVVLDVDPRSGGSLAALGEMPDTWTAETGGGGWHVWFRCEGRVRGHLYGTAGIDIKTDTGYLVAPPSVHPNGSRYRWANQSPIAILPDHLRERVQVPMVLPFPTRTFTRNRGSSAALVRSVQEATPGRRNHVLFWAASRAYAEGAEPEVLQAISDAAESIGLPPTEVDATMRSAQRSAA